MIEALSLLAFGMPGTHEWIIILLVVVVLFGATRIPALGSAIGKGISNFRKGMRDLKDEDEEEAKKALAESKDKDEGNDAESGDEKAST